MLVINASAIKMSITVVEETFRSLISPDRVPMPWNLRQKPFFYIKFLNILFTVYGHERTVLIEHDDGYYKAIDVYA